MGDLFIKKANLKKGSLSRQLGIPVKKNIPVTLLNKILRTKVGQKINNPTQAGKRVINVTPLLKKRSSLARTLKNFKRR